MKKLKLTIKSLEVKSLVTNIDSQNSETIQGGGTGRLSNKLCPTQNCPDPTFNCDTQGGSGCQNHTALHHNCSEAICYSNFCGSTGCGPKSDICPV